MIGIIGAMEVELAQLLERMLITETKVVDGMNYLQGIPCHHDRHLVQFGISNFNCAICVHISYAM